MAAKEGMQVAARICPDNRCVMMVIAVALFVYRILLAEEKHVRFAKQSSGGVEAVDERVSIFTAPYEVNILAKLNRLWVHAVIVQHF